MNLASYIEKEKKISLDMNNIKLFLNGEEIMSGDAISNLTVSSRDERSAYRDTGTLRGVRANMIWLDDYEPSE